MNILPTFIPARRRVHRKRRLVQTGSGPAALVLVSGAFDSDERTLTLVFSRGVDIAGIVAPDIHVDDGAVSGSWYEGNPDGVVQLSTTTLQFGMLSIGEASGPTTTLSASDATGIVAADDGAPWAGVTNLELPFG
jgi:hypothetical protein